MSNSDSDPNVNVPSLWERGVIKKSKAKHSVTRNVRTAPLMESEIRDAQFLATSIRQVVKRLGVSPITYRKYAELYGIYDDVKRVKVSQDMADISKKMKAKSLKYELDDILEGKYPNYDVAKLKKRLLTTGYMEEKCATCGFCERRITDHRVPLVLDFIDGDRKNHKYANLRMLCFNCSFLINGNLSGNFREYIY